MVYFESNWTGIVDELLLLAGKPHDYTARAEHRKLKPLGPQAGKYERQFLDAIRGTQLENLRCMDGDLFVLNDKLRITAAVSIKSGAEQSSYWQLEALAQALNPDIRILEIRRVDCDVSPEDSRYRIYYHR